jgi:small subunit ribosomal protein S18
MHRRRKVCVFCGQAVNKDGEKNPEVIIDYKDTAKLRKYVSERGKILPRRVTGCCAKHQRALTTSIRKHVM